MSRKKIKMVVTVTTESEINPDEINDIMVAALEGGINYWCDKVKIVKNSDAYNLNEDKIRYASDVLGYGGELIMFFDGEQKVLNQEMILNGITMYCESNGVSYEDMYENHDADTADHIVQYALFNEIVYG